jgi:hypothetical protein
MQKKKLGGNYYLMEQPRMDGGCIKTRLLIVGVSTMENFIARVITRIKLS